jgi:hypothetical protein
MCEKILFRTFFSLAQRKEGKRKRAQHPLFCQAMPEDFKTYPNVTIPPFSRTVTLGAQVLFIFRHHSV